MALVAAWNFNEASGNAIDVSGNGNTAVATGTTRVAGQSGYGNAISLNGTSSDFLTIAVDTGSLGQTVGPMTISAWIKGGERSAAAAIFEVAESPSNSLGFSLVLSNPANGAMSFTTKGVFDYGSSTNYPTDGAWHHFAAVLDSSFDVTFYVDGATLGTVITGTTAANANTTQEFFIGGSCDGVATPNRFWWLGEIDDLRIYNHAQTSGEITTDMNTPLASLPSAATLMGAILL